jgi:hypothetical protein
MAVDWLSAAIEFVVIVAGIFVALQVNKWNDARHDRATERRYISRLFEDIEGSILDRQVEVNWNAHRLETTDVVLEALRARSLDDSQREKFELGLVYLGQENPTMSRWGTVRELQSTGRLDVLRDIEIRKLIAETEYSFDFSQLVFTLMRDQITQLLPVIAARVEVLESGFVASDPVRAFFDFDDLAKDQTIRNTIGYIRVHSNVVVRANARHHASVDELREKLAALKDTQ